ncbi:hypothetical protein BDV11DRAFT_197729 [Aspergillus similis]
MVSQNLKSFYEVGFGRFYRWQWLRPAFWTQEKPTCLIYSVHSMVSWMQSLACLISTLTLSSLQELGLGPKLKPTASRSRYFVGPS